MLDIQKYKRRSEASVVCGEQGGQVVGRLEDRKVPSKKESSVAYGLIVWQSVGLVIETLLDYSSIFKQARSVAPLEGL